MLAAASCAQTQDSPPEREYGDIYFYMDCYWVDPATVTDSTVWRCYNVVETELLSGFLYLELENKLSLYFCGENLELNSGIDIYDNLIGLITRDKYDCLHITEDKIKGNEFDWDWDSSSGRLQIIWRPEDADHKMITLVIPQEIYGAVVRSPLYYKILN
jgi:hypothetical protein